jgi:hypothetical protein
MSDEIRIILVGSSVLTALIGLFLVIKIFMVWNRVDRNVLKARVFLDNTFLVKNWIFVFLTGAFIVVRIFVELLELLGFILIRTSSIIFDLAGLAVIILLVLLAYYWYRMVYTTIR